MDYYGDWLDQANYIAHYGVGHLNGGHSGRYPWGSGNRPRQSTGFIRNFSKARNEVRQSATNTCRPITEEKVNLQNVMSRGGLTRDEGLECIQLAKKAFDRSRIAEPRITRDVIACASASGCKMYGLDHRLKQPTSIAGKIGSDAKDDGVSFEKAARSMSDLIRYTALSEDAGYTKAYYSIVNALAQRGYIEVKCKNYFESYRQGKVKHKAVQSVFEDRSGHPFELQFQTPSSQAAKELKIPIYNERRSSGLSEQRKAELEQMMTDLAEMVPNPRGVFDIESHKGR